MIKKLLVILFWVALLILSLIVFRAEAEAPENKALSIEDYAREQVGYAFGDGHWDAFNNIITRESRWNCTAQNPRSTAFGLGQLLNGTWKETGYEKTDDCYMQVHATISYIEGRYKTPVNAWKHWQKKSWY
jgi:hypothetical protein